MDKMQEIDEKEKREEQIFVETIRLRENIIKCRSKIVKMLKQIGPAEVKATEANRQFCAAMLETSLAENQLDEITKKIKIKLEKVQYEEMKVANLKKQFKGFVRSELEKGPPKIIPAAPSSLPDDENVKHQQKIEMWKNQGVASAMSITSQHQETVLKVTSRIKENLKTFELEIANDSE